MPVLRLDGFAGPMDLLLDLAERQRVDLGAISIRALAEQFTAEMERQTARVPVARRAAWLVLASRLIWLRSRLLCPASPAEQAKAEATAASEEARLALLVEIRAAAGWLAARPQLGQEVFTRPATEEAREGGYVALMEACLVVLRGPEVLRAPPPVYSPMLPDLWRVSDALPWIAARLAERPEGGTLGAFLPPIPEAAPERPLRLRSAIAATLLAGLELARDGRAEISQDVSSAGCRLRATGQGG